MDLKHQNLKVVAQRDPEAPEIWIAQTLRGDLVGQGPTLKAAIDDLQDAVRAMLFVSLQQGNAAGAFTPEAPSEDQCLFEKVMTEGSPVAGGLTPEFFADADQNVLVLATWIRVVYMEQGATVGADRSSEVLKGLAFRTDVIESAANC